MHGDLDRKQLHIGRFENLQSEFLSIMKSLEVDEVDALQAKFDKNPRLNTSRHSHYSKYLDAEMRELIAQRESAMIERFGYRFEADDSDDKAIEFPSIQISYRNDGFQKLSGEARNFLLLKPEVDLSFIKRKLTKIPERAWHGSGREKTYEVHKQTKPLLLIHDDDFRHIKPTCLPLFNTFRADLEPLFQRFPAFYKSQGYFVRALFAKLKAGGFIAPHIDRVPSLLNCHRVHLPIISNEDVWFCVGGESVNMQVGELMEINNGTIHSVENKSDEDRIHLIIDWVPYRMPARASR